MPKTTMPVQIGADTSMEEKKNWIEESLSGIQDRLAELRGRTKQKEYVKIIERESGYSIAPSTYSGLENERRPTIEQLLAIWKTYDGEVSFDWLLGVSKDKQGQYNIEVMSDKWQYLLDNLPVNQKDDLYAYGELLLEKYGSVDDDKEDFERFLAEKAEEYWRERKN